MLEGWSEFYLMVGSSAAALIGLLFVVATLTADMEERRVLRGQRLFMTPTVFHFAVVFVISAVGTVEHMAAETIAIVTAAAALIGFLYMLPRLADQMKPNATEHWTDIIFYGLSPMAGYLALGVTAWTVFDGLPIATMLLAGMMLGFLLLGIRNAWDLVTWIAPRTHRPDPPDISKDRRKDSS